MAKKTALPAQGPAMTPTHLRQSIDRLKRRLEVLEDFDPKVIRERFRSPELNALAASIRGALARTFGEGTSDYNTYASIAYFDEGPISFSGGRSVSLSEVHDRVAKSKAENVALLRQAIEGLEERLLESGDHADTTVASPVSAGLSKRVFIVHGHDKEAKESVARVLHVLGLEPIILNEQPNMGRTIIEKFEAEGKVGFAVVLLTPDDLGKAKDAKELALRARQNVILELGYFVGSLGRHKVCALVRSDVELPSDFAGVVYERFDEQGKWKMTLGKELRAAGYEIDGNKLLDL